MRALQIAIVDDMDKDREWLSAKLDTYLRAHHIHYVLSSYTSGEEFLEALSERWFSIVFMDIYMGEISGLEAARVLRSKDRDCKLIFLTSSEEFMRQGFSLNSAHYLIKPVSDEDFRQAMENCRIRRPCGVPCLTLCSEGIFLEVDTINILYINMEKRMVIVHTKSGDLSAGRSFGRVKEQLENDRRFLMCNKGTLVNLDFVASMEEDSFILVNGKQIPFALHRKKELTVAYRRYVFGSLGE